MLYALLASLAILAGAIVFLPSHNPRTYVAPPKPVCVEYREVTKIMPILVGKVMIHMPFKQKECVRYE